MNHTNFDIHNGYFNTSSINDHTIDSTTNTNHHHHHHIDRTVNHHTFIADADLSQLSLEIEKESTGFNEKSRHLQEQLEALRHEIDELKVDDSPIDDLHREQQEQGNTKYSTIQKVKRGTTQSRIDIFEVL